MSEDDLDRAIAAHAGEPPLRDAIDLSRIGAYRGLGEVLEALARLRDERGARVSFPARGHDGTPIPAIELGPSPGSAARASLVIGGIHAMEWIGVETALALAEQLAEQELDRTITIFPILNADGFRAAELDLRAGRRTYRRANARGVDLNRNWPTHWRTTAAIPRMLPALGSSGARAGTEPEVRAVLDAIARTKERATLDRAVSLHSFGRVLLIPWGGRFALPPEHPRLHAIASRVRDRMSTRYAIRTPARWIPGFFAFGMELDHLLSEGIEPLLVECSGGGISLLDPSSWTHPFRWYNPPDPGTHAREIARALVPFALGDDPR